MRTFIILLSLCTMSSFFSIGQESTQLHLMPWPSDVKASTGQMVIDPSFSVSLKGSDPRLKKTAQIFLDDLRRHTGMLALDFSIAENPAQGHPSLESQASTPARKSRSLVRTNPINST